MSTEKTGADRRATLPEVDTGQLVRLLRALLEGYVPKVHEDEAEVLASAIETHVRAMGQRLIAQSFAAGIATAIEVYKAHQDRDRLIIPDDLLYGLLTATPDQTH